MAKHNNAFPFTVNNPGVTSSLATVPRLASNIWLHVFLAEPVQPILNKCLNKIDFHSRDNNVSLYHLSYSRRSCLRTKRLIVAFLHIC